MKSNSGQALGCGLPTDRHGSKYSSGHCVPIYILWTSSLGCKYVRSLSLAFNIAGLSLIISTGTLSAQSDDGSLVRAKKFEAWISELGSADYSQRQMATIQLDRNKKEALDYVIRAIVTARGEQADRLLQFLSSIAADPSSSDGELAYQSIQEIAFNRTTSKATRAQKILQVISDEQQELAIVKLHSRGIQIGDHDFQIISSSTRVRDALVIDASFAGSAEDLECIRWLSLVEFVRLEGPKISAQILRHVVRMPGLKRLQLVNTQLQSKDFEILLDAPDLDLLEVIYAPIGDESIETLMHLPVQGDLYLFGTKLSKRGEVELRSRIDGPDLLIGRGGFLGVVCMPTSVIVDRVVARGAAEIAGIQGRDKIISINKVPVYVFDDIRRELANHAAGEDISVELERDEMRFNDEGRMERARRRMTLEVTLLKRQDSIN
jgi:PDZ domain